MSDQTERSDEERLPFSLAVMEGELGRERRGMAGDVGEGMLAVFCKG